MKKILCLLALILLTQNAWSMQIEGLINWGKFLNCEIYNNSDKPVIVKNYQYNIDFTNGSFNQQLVICRFGCTIAPFQFKRFTGPRNSPHILGAYCSANVLPLGHRH